MARPTKARGARSLGRAAALSLALGTLLVGWATGSALASPNNEANRHRLDSTVRFLQNAQNSDGGFSADGNSGEPSDPEFTPWAAIALAAAGINPQDQSRPGGESAFAYLADRAGSLTLTTEFERVLLVVDAAGTSPRDFGGVDLQEAILSRRLPEGAFVHERGDPTPAINDTVFAILALSPIHEPAVQEVVKSAAGWLETEQNTSAGSASEGSWPSVCPKTAPGCGSDPEGNVDMTAAAIEALNAAGMHESEAQSRAFAYLHRVQNPDGGFPEHARTAREATNPESDTASTSWTVQAIWSAGENPEGWRQQSTGKEPLGYLESMQHEDGSVQLDAGSDANPVWMTAYAAPAFAGQPLPPPVVPREERSTSPAGGGAGVLAGGGGEGAPLFSRPQPQSQGHTPGGARQLRRRRAAKAARHPREPALRVAAPASSSRGAGRRSRSGADRRRRGTGSGSASPTVTGLLLNASDDTPLSDPPQAGAPGLRSAGASAGVGRWLAIAIGGLIVVLILAGAQLERRRPQVLL